MADRVHNRTPIGVLAALAAVAALLFAASSGPAQKPSATWWSLRPLTRPTPPPIRGSGVRLDNLIDRFLLARLDRAGLKFSPAADRRTLIRRLSFDVTGLPPTPEEVDAFLADRSPQAYDNLVDRLLSSPHYGERWARHWLDVIRFGESQGFERNKFRPNAWKYRDWVVEALNADMPYDEFVRLQIAGDVLRPDDPMAVLATGFLVMGPYDLTAYTTGTKPMQLMAREEEIEGLVGTVSQTFMGLTANCARCHDHKFDPIPQKEYYRLASALGGTYHGDEREILSAEGKPKAEEERQKLAKEKERLTASLQGSKEPAAVKAAISRLESRMRLLEGGKAHFTAPKEPGVFHVLARGDYRSKGEAVAPGGLTAVIGVSAEWSLAQDAPEKERRKALATWIANANNPLTARVIVNRIWAHYFGSGIVPTPSDFGASGGRPSHPELLDWLAGELVRGGWKTKRIHRIILTSQAYRQSSRPIAAAMKKDAENRLLWRQTPRRLEAEPFRDAVLAVSGQLDRSIGGPGFRDWTMKTQGENDYYTLVEDDKPEYNRRSLYRTVIRAGTHPFLDVLDCPDPSVATARRTSTTTPLQALTLLNSGFMERSAKRFAARVAVEVPGSVKGQIAQAYRLALGRGPSAAESEFAGQFSAKHGLEQFCLVLLNTNEFTYVD